MFTMKHMTVGIGAAIIVTLSHAALAADAVEEVIVTGVAAPTTKLSSSYSVTALSADDISDFTPRSTAEIFRNLPGIQAEATGGDSNANIKVRGMPISAGGSRYLSIQEDSLPLLLIGDMEFATSDSFLRFGNGVRSVQSIRGGAGSTQAPNSPGGIVNFLSHTGDEKGGSVGLTYGADHSSTRIDSNYGTPMDNGWSYHVSGFFRDGEGPRDVPDNIESGIQIKGNITKDLDNGYLRVHLKRLDDRSPTFLPIPVMYDGSGFTDIGVDLGDGTLYLEGNDILNREDGRETTSLTKGFEADVTSLGLEGELDFADNTSFGFNTRMSTIAGQFVSPFPAAVAKNNNGGYDVTIHYFNTKLDSLDNLFADLYVKHKAGNINVKGGVFYGVQDYDAQWGWNTYDVTLNGSLSPTAYTRTPGHDLWGNCCQRSYDLEITNIAPNFSLNGDLGENLIWDVSLRQDMWQVKGNYVAAGDVDAEGYPTYGDPTKVDYDLGYTSVSVGLNYALEDNSAVFGSFSNGGSATAPSRVSTNAYDENGGLGDEKAGYSTTTMLEFGYKRSTDNTALYVTVFRAETEESGGFEVTSQTSIQNSYESQGVEVEGSYSTGNGFLLGGSITLTDAEITDSNTEDNIGNKPRRQADYIFNITPSYTWRTHNVGLNFVGTDETFISDSNEGKFDGFIVTNLFWNYEPIQDWHVGLNVNNLLDEVGFTEGEEGGPFEAGDTARIRPINGRTASLTARYDF